MPNVGSASQPRPVLTNLPDISEIFHRTLANNVLKNDISIFIMIASKINWFS